MPTDAHSLTVFDFHDNPVRTVMVDGVPWFVGKDVCRCLEISNHNDALARLDDDERKGVGITDPLGKNSQETTVVAEPGVYRLIFTSRRPEAERFRRWVFHEVLPTLRRTGSYTLDRAEIETMKDRIEIVREARRIAGAAAARDLWLRLGLPPLDDDARELSPQAGGLAAYVSDFLGERTEADPVARVRSTALHDAYLEWSRLNKAPYIMASVFGRMLVATGLRKVKSNGLPVYLGLRIKA